MRRRGPSFLLVLISGLSVTAGTLVVTSSASAAPASGVPASAVAVAAPRPHPVSPKLQVLHPRGVDQPALTTLRGSTAGSPGLVAKAGGATAPAVLIPPTSTARFTLVGLTWQSADAPAGVDVRVRVREHGVWLSWQPLGVEDGGPDPDTAEGRVAATTSGTDPLLSNGADGVQVLVHTATGQAPPGLAVDLIDGGTSTADGEPPAPAGQVDSAPQAASAAAPASAVAAPAPTSPPLGVASSAPVGSAPAVITRSQWGADERIRKPVGYNSIVRAMVIHHTDTTNSYSTLAQAEAQVRSVYAFHVLGRHWSDIGYNFVVDHFGHVFEGRAGSLTKAILGAHTGGFNTDTMGVAALGTFISTTPPAAMISAISRVVAWKMGQYGSNPNGKQTLTSAGGGTSRYPAGTRITVNTITGHRTFGRTACPGDALWAKLASIRAQVTALIARQPVGTGYWPVMGVWTAGGGIQPGWFKDGFWWLRQPNGTTLKVRFGIRGDVPVVGDWDADGVTGLGVYRNGTWYVTNHPSASSPIDLTWVYGGTGFLPLTGIWPGTTQLGIGVNAGNVWSFRGSLSAGGSLIGFTYGQIGDQPIAADWDGDGFTSIGVVRLGATWYLIDGLVPSAKERVIAFGHYLDLGSAADWDGNGSVTPAVVRSNGWRYRNDLLSGYAQQVVTYSPSG